MHKWLLKSFSWIFLGLISLSLIHFFLFQTPVQLGGDIIDYFGVTETILKNGSLYLTPETKESLSQILNPGYFINYYNISGKNGFLYPVHFIFYSFILLPFRIILQILNFDELRSFYLANIFIFISSIVFIWKKYLHKQTHRLIFLTLALASSLISFFKWPGPDLIYLSLLLISCFAFFNEEFLLASLVTAVASWHSQPLTILSGLMFLVHFRTQKINLKIIFQSILVGLIMIIPYIYNYFIFGVMNTWSIIPDGWTKLRGFGLQNLSFFKLYEQFFDLNMGLFWYVPTFILSGLIFAFTEIKKSRNFKPIYLLLSFIITAFFYQTNPAWHYGTSGYGPSRHAIFMLPLFIVLTFELIINLKNKFLQVGLISLGIIINLLILKTNNFLAPNLEKTHYHNYAARFVLNYFPQIYNPTPEIFVDRTNHLEKDLPVTAIYKIGGKCKKAFVLITDEAKLKQECGYVPEKYQLEFEKNFPKVANFDQQIMVTQAKLFPTYLNCQKKSTFPCLDSIEVATEKLGVDQQRIDSIESESNSWEISPGDPLLINIPAGYTISYQSLDGIYVNF